jgi:FSR family fosmidomycin resistance protein-like MFS transporter
LGLTLITANAEEKRILAYTGIAHAVSDAWHIIFPALLFLIAVDHPNFFFLGVLANITVASRAVSGVVAGFMADRYSSRMLYGAFAILSAIGCFVIYLTSGTVMLGVGLFVLGVGTGIYHPVGLSSITRFVRRRTEGLGIHESAGSLGLSLFPVLLISIGIAYGWRSAFLLGGFVSLVPLFLLPLIPARFDKPRDESSDQDTGWSEVLRVFTSKRVLVMYGAVVLLEASSTGVETFLPVAIADIGGLGQGTIGGISTTGLFLSMMILIGVPGSLLGGMIGARWGSDRTLAVMTLAPLPILALFAVLTGNAFLALAPILRALTNARSPALNALIGANLPAGMQGKGFALMYGISPAVASLVTLAAGAVAEAYGLKWIFPLGGVLLIAAFPLAYLGHRYAKAEASAKGP